MPTLHNGGHVREDAPPHAATLFICSPAAGLGAGLEEVAEQALLQLVGV